MGLGNKPIVSDVRPSAQTDSRRADNLPPVDPIPHLHQTHGETSKLVWSLATLPVCTSL